MIGATAFDLIKDGESEVLLFGEVMVDGGLADIEMFCEVGV